MSKGGGLAEVVESLGLVRTGEPRELPSNWNAAWSNAFMEWMSVENLEERATARRLDRPASAWFST